MIGIPITNAANAVPMKLPNTDMMNSYIVSLLWYGQLSHPRHALSDGALVHVDRFLPCRAAVAVMIGEAVTALSEDHRLEQVWRIVQSAEHPHVQPYEDRRYPVRSDVFLNDDALTIVRRLFQPASPLHHLANRDRQMIVVEDVI